jgi:hypothetical protein
MVNVFASLSKLISIFASPNSVFASPIEIKCFSLEVASVPLEISSRKNISWSEYKNFLINGKMFSTDTLIFPLLIIKQFKS